MIHHNTSKNQKHIPNIEEFTEKEKKDIFSIDTKTIKITKKTTFFSSVFLGLYYTSPEMYKIINHDYLDYGTIILFNTMIVSLIVTSSYFTSEITASITKLLIESPISPIRNFFDKKKTLKIHEKINYLRSLENHMPNLSRYIDKNYSFLEPCEIKAPYKTVFFESSENIPFEKMTVSYKSNFELYLDLFLKDEQNPEISVKIRKIPGEISHKIIKCISSKDISLKNEKDTLEGLERIFILGLEKIINAKKKIESDHLKNLQKKKDLKNSLEEKIADFKTHNTRKTIETTVQAIVHCLENLPNQNDQDYTTEKEKTITLYKNILTTEKNYLNSEKLSDLISYQENLEKYTLLFSFQKPQKDTNTNLERDITKHLTEFLKDLQKIGDSLEETQEKNTTLEKVNLQKIITQTNNFIHINSCG